MSRRWREPTPKPGVLEVRYGKMRHDFPDLLYVNGGQGSARADALVLSYAFEDVPVHNGKTLRQVLIERGYDITTLRFSIARTPTPQERQDDE